MPSLKAKTKSNTVPPDGVVSGAPGRGVARCLVWPDGRPIEHDPNASNFVLPVKGEVGRPTNRGYNMPEPMAYPSSQNHDETALQALRGWPGARHEEEPVSLPPVEEPKKTKKKKGGKKDDKYPNPEAEGHDPFMHDLIGHRYLNDFVSAREAEARREEMKRLRIEQRAMDSTLAMKEIKHTRTSELRSIANGPDIKVEPKELWQMKRFSDKAQPHLSTTGSRGRSGGAKASGGSKRGGAQLPAVGGGGDFVVIDNCDALPPIETDRSGLEITPRFESPVEPPKGSPVPSL